MSKKSDGFSANNTIMADCADSLKSLEKNLSTVKNPIFKNKGEAADAAEDIFDTYEALYAQLKELMKATRSVITKTEDNLDIIDG